MSQKGPIARDPRGKPFDSRWICEVTFWDSPLACHAEYQREDDPDHADCGWLDRSQFLQRMQDHAETVKRLEELKAERHISNERLIWALEAAAKAME